jgi:hypothetical protein
MDYTCKMASLSKIVLAVQQFFLHLARPQIG